MDSGLAHAHVIPPKKVPFFLQVQQCGSHCRPFTSLAMEWGHPWLFPDLVASLEPGTGLLNLSMLRMR